MVKLFGFMLALAAMIGSANAALLLSYEYSTDKNATFVESGLIPASDGSSGSFGGPNGVVSAQQSSSGSSTTRNSNERFFFSTNAASAAQITSMTFVGAVASGSRVQTWTAAFNLGTAVGDGLDSSPPEDGFVAGTTITGTISGPVGNMYTVTFATPISLTSANILRTTINAAGVGTSTTTVTLDDVKFYGSVVPEPASMAVFGLLGAGVAIRRLRRKA